MTRIRLPEKAVSEAVAKVAGFIVGGLGVMARSRSIVETHDFHFRGAKLLAPSTTSTSSTTSRARS